MLLNDDTRVSEIPALSDRSDKRRLAEGVLLYIVSVTLVAAGTIVLFGVASISLLGTSPSTDTPPPSQAGGSQEVIAEPLSIADEASAAQHASGATMPPLATSDGQPDQISHNFEIRRNNHDSLDQGRAASTPEGRFLEETQVNESTGSYGSAASPRSHPPLRHAASRRPGVVQADRDNIAKKLNRAVSVR